MIDALWQAFLVTLYMVGVSAAIVWLVGIPLAIVLVTTAQGQIFEAPPIDRVLGSIVGGFTITLVAMISASAMAGAGGLGDLASATATSTTTPS